ncbi:hypothetical protein GTS_38200 [Gandjariella thermophila]|uniref:Uncharacterized protein n=1 Tax=Gandjariella thermophila TaxID=1931992 RepID=A0A4D4JE51_9PSEU|nr:hypothetical protein GTS_38200 [Gandjariella thermophila]
MAHSEMEVDREGTPPGRPREPVHDARRVAAVVQAAAATLDAERALAGSGRSESRTTRALGSLRTPPPCGAPFSSGHAHRGACRGPRTAGPGDAPLAAPRWRDLSRNGRVSRR